MEIRLSYLLFTTILCILTLKFVNSVEYYGRPIGCLKFRHESSEDFYFKVNSTSAMYTVENCLNSCLKLNSYRYGGIMISKGCFCLTYIGSQDNGECQSPCPENKTQICGGKDSLSVYATGHYVPGPPDSLNVVKVSDTSIEVNWTKPIAVNGIILQYIVSASYVETVASMPLESRLKWSYPNTTLKASLLNLHPSTNYNISVSAGSDQGDGTSNSITVWTHIGEPTEPDQPEVIARNKNNMTIRLKPYVNENGPVSGFRIIVITEENAFFEPHNLMRWSEAKENDTPYYIAAELDPKDSTKDFVIGDSRTYGRFFNPPLNSQKNYRVVLGVRSTFLDMTKFSYSRGTVSVIVFTNHNDNDESGLVSSLVAAIVISSIILCGLFVAYFIIRKQLSYRRRRAPYRQELTLQGPIVEIVRQLSNIYLICRHCKWLLELST